MGKEEDPPKVELTADEKKAWHVKGGKPDMLPYVLSATFHQFSTPEKEEGFDEIRYEWAKQPKASEYIKNWVLERKLTTRIDDLKPGQWFLGKRSQWNSLIHSWQSKQSEYRNKVARRESEKAAKKAAALAAKKAEEAVALAKKRKAEEDAKKAEEDAKKKEEAA